jgi:hypothetical protein
MGMKKTLLILVFVVLESVAFGQERTIYSAPYYLDYSGDFRTLDTDARALERAFSQMFREYYTKTYIQREVDGSKQIINTAWSRVQEYVAKAVADGYGTETEGKTILTVYEGKYNSLMTVIATAGLQNAFGGVQQ